MKQQAFISRMLLLATILLVLPFALINVSRSGASGGTTTRVSVTSDGMQGNGNSFNQSISADGRYVAFGSGASNLVSGDTNGYFDVFVYDRQTGQTTRASVASDGTQGNGNSGLPFISTDGRYVAFESRASNLVPGDTNGILDVFVHDRQTGRTSRVSVASDGTQGNGHSERPSISTDGRYVAFQSRASNLVPGDTNGVLDVFVHDRQTGETSRISAASDGTQGDDSSTGPSISADGRYVAFNSHAANLVRDDTNGYYDIFVYDRQMGETSRVSVASDGTQGNGSTCCPSISADGRYVAFNSHAANLVPGDTNGHYDIFVHDRQMGETSRVSVASDGTQGNGSSTSPSISADGRYVAFESWSTNLVPADTNDYRHIIVHDRQTGHTTRVSVASDGMQGTGHSDQSSISADGRYVTFHSEASNLVPGDTNGALDVFVHDRGAPGALPIPSPSLSPTALMLIQATPATTVVVVPSETISEALVQSTATLIIQEDEPPFAAADSVAGHEADKEGDDDDRMILFSTTERDSVDNWMGLAVAGILAVAGLMLLFAGGVFIWRQRVSAISLPSAICPNCGVSVAASACFCFRCGRQLSRE